MMLVSKTRNQTFESLLERLKQDDPAIKEVNLNGRSIGDTGVKRLCDALEGNSNVSVLRLKNNGISANGVIAIASLIKNRTPITRLDLGRNKIGDMGCRYLSFALVVEHTAIQTLGLEKNGISNAGFLTLANSLQRNLSIISLSIKGNIIDDEKTKEDVMALLESRQEISARMEDLLEKVRDNDSSLTEIMIGGGRVGDFGAALLARALETNDAVKRVCLPWNDISGRGCVAIASTLEMNMSISFLDLGHNDICDEGAIKLAAALSSNETVEVLGICNNNIGNAGAGSLAACLPQNDALTMLDMRENQITNEVVRAKLRDIIGMKNYRAAQQKITFVVDTNSIVKEMPRHSDSSDVSESTNVVDFDTEVQSRKNEKEDPTVTESSTSQGCQSVGGQDLIRCAGKSSVPDVCEDGKHTHKQQGVLRHVKIGSAFSKIVSRKSSMAEVA